MMCKPRGALAALALMTLVAACGPSKVVSEVTRYHDAGDGAFTAGGSFVIEPLDSDRTGSLEFKTLAGVLAEELERIGLQRRQDSDAPPDLTIGLDYRIDDGQVVIRTIPGRSYFRPIVHSVGGQVYYTPAYSYTPPQTISTLVFTRAVELEMRAPDGDVAFEGTATSRGREGQLPQVFRQMVRSMLFDFPGESGETIQVEMPASNEEMTAMPKQKALF